MLESFKRFLHNQPFQNASMNGPNKHQDMMHNTEESERSLNDAEEFLTPMPVKQRKPLHQGIRTQLEIQM